jgi:hypothetical protein
MSPATHEDFDRHEIAQGSSDRLFGLVFSAVFAVLGLWPLWGARPVRTWALGVSAVFLAASLLRPAMLSPLNRLWQRLGLLLQRITNPIVLGLLFFGTVLPIGLLMRLAGKNPLRLGFDRDAKSYWIERQPPGPAPDTMPRQF